MEHNQDQLLTESEAGVVMGGGAQGLREPPLMATAACRDSAVCQTAGSGEEAADG